MSDSSLPRRQPPSPLVFSPETVLAPVQSHASSSNLASHSSHGSGTNTVSMPFVRRHVTRRLKAAKSECDKELQRVTNSITAFFEERLREGEHEQEFEREQREVFRGRDQDRQSQHADPQSLREAFVFQPAELKSALQFDDVSSDGGYDAEPEGSSHHSRQRASLDEDRPKQPTLTHWSSSPGLLTASVSSTSPASLRRHPTLPRDKPVPIIPSSTGTSSPALTTPNTPPPEQSSPRKQSNVPQPNQWSGQSLASRRLSRTIHIPVRPPRSGQSSRSTSRSRSPLPRSGYTDVSSRDTRRSSRILVDDPIDPIMTTLYEIIGVATDVTEMSISQLTAQPKVCEQLVQRVQNIGKVWDEHPDWHGRNWYVQVLLAVASLSRVVEWWEAEKQFWNFDDNDDEQEESLTFVMKPAEEEVPAATPQMNPAEGGSSLRLSSEDEFRLRMTRTSSQGRRSRDEVTKDLSMTPAAQAKEHDQGRGASKFSDHTESARVLATERLRLQAETAQNQNVVMELSLDGDHIVWLNYAWRNIVGSDPEDMIGTRVSKLLAPSDWHVFRDATRRLLEDDSQTLGVQFKLLVSDPDTDVPSVGSLYQQMEGKGMLMLDREDGHPSHTMWVIKTVGPPEYLQAPPSILLESGDVGDEPASAEASQASFGHRTAFEPVTPFPGATNISTQLILCRICECSVPQWFFEKHNETCSEVHRLEAEIGECNESISELRNTIRELASAMDRSSPMTVPEYRGMPIFTPSTSPGPSSPLALLRAPLNKKRMNVKKMQRQVLEQLEDILLIASEVAVPALKEEESPEPIERQRLLSPDSEHKMSLVRRWVKPCIEDAALSQLVEDAERVMLQKIDNVVRMQNTIKYSEKIRQEWEDKVEQTLSTLSDTEEEDEEGLEEEREGEGQGRDDDQSSTTSEYAFSGMNSSSDPTPMASTSPVPFTTERARSEPEPERRGSVASPPNVPIPPAAPSPAYSWQPAPLFQTRSSTPSSISSPLALAAPIMAPMASEDLLPPMDLNEPPSVPIRTRRSPQNLEPKLLITPPLSPLVSPQDGSLSRRISRRHSTAQQPILSPTTSVSGMPLSPRLPSVAPSSRTTPTSIKDFEIIKPISKGAFGSVFLAKKKVTGDYFAIKVLKKADMIAKNQITNVKAERMILMKQAESPFVAKLYFTFQSKENLYLVMEYLNGGDCAALIKSLGSLPEEWTRNYIAEVTLGLEYLHQRGIVHRDLKPDNLLIDQHGHLKLTDFGLSRIGLLGRQTREGQLPFERLPRPRARHSPGSRPPSIDSAYMSSPMLPAELLAGGSYFVQRPQSISRLGSSPYLPITDDYSESSGSESLSGAFPIRRAQSGNGHSSGSGRQLSDSPLQSFATELTNDLRSHPTPGGTPPGEQKVVGTPDYLAPETILGLRGDDAAVDWWALGVITYEFLYGIPPFHDETPEKVFENILSGHIEWHEDYFEVSPEARDFMQRLMTVDPQQRLGANGAEEVKAHPFLAGIDWDKVTTTEAAFIPQVTDPESTDYFDPRGAVLQLFHDSEQPLVSGQLVTDSPSGSESPSAFQSATAPVPMVGRETTSTPPDEDFGSFSFKNLPVLKQANDDVIRKLKTDQLAPLTQTLSEPGNMHSRRRSISNRVKKPSSVVTALDTGMKPSTTNPPSPATSTSSISSSVSRGPPTPGSAGHARKPSDYGAVERFKLNHMDGDGLRRNSMPSRLRTASVSTNDEGSVSDWAAPTGSVTSQFESTTPPSSVASVEFKPLVDLKRAPDPNDRAVTCLLAEDNPITAKIIETLLIRLGCRCVVVADGSEAISVAMGDIKFDVILMDLHMPILDGEGAARYIKSTANKNAHTPIIAVSAYSASDTTEPNNLFAAYIAKPVQKTDLLAAMRQLGFKTSTVQGRGPGTKVTASR